MPNKVQRSFASGELAPAHYANADIQAYQDGLKTARNVIIQKTGGVQNRPGTEYLGATKASGAARLVEATFDDTLGYVLEFGNLYVRPWLDGALITGMTTSVWSGSSVVYAQGWLVTTGGNTYVCFVAHTSGASTEPGVGASWATRWHSLGASASAVYEYPTPYTTAQLDEMSEQAKVTELNVVTIAHVNHEPAALTRIPNPTTGAPTTEYVWVLNDLQFNSPGGVPTNVAVVPSGAGLVGYAVSAMFADGSESTLSATVLTPHDNYFFIELFGTVNATITWDPVPDAVLYGVYRVNGFLVTLQDATTGTSFVDASPFNTTLNGPVVSQALFGSAGNYPRVVGAYQQRLLFGGTDNNPDVVEASRTAEATNFTVTKPLVDSDAMSWRQVLAGGRLNRVRDIVEFAERLAVLSSAAETLVQGDGIILRPGEVNPRVISQHGSATIPRALVVGDTALYVSRGNVVRDLVPSQQGVIGSDVSLLANHLVRGHTIVDWCYQQEPDSIVWLVRDDGVLLSCTYVREAGIIAWAHHDTAGTFESVACVSEDGRDVVYAVVARTINSSAVRYVERMTDRLAAVPVLMDSATTTDVNGVLTRTSLGKLAAHSHTPVANISTAFVAGNWTPATNGSDAVDINGRLAITYSASGGSNKFNVYTPIADRLDVAVQTVWYDRSFGAGTGGVAARIATGVDPNGGMVCATASGTTASRLLRERTAGSTVQEDITAGIDDTLPQRFTMELAGTVARGYQFAPDRTFNLTGVARGSGPVGIFTSSGFPPYTYEFEYWAATTSAVLTVTGLPTGYTVQVLDGSDNILATATESAGTALLDLLEVDWSLPRKLRVRDALGTARIVETPTDGVWGGDVYTYGGAVTSEFSGLDHLEGEAVSAVDTAGLTHASPYNAAYTAVAVSSGDITLDGIIERVTVGLPYVSDIQTLDIDTQGSTMKPQKFLITSVGAYLEGSMAFWTGPEEPTTATGLTLPNGGAMQELQVIDRDENATSAPQTGFRALNFEGRWNESGTVFIRNVDPTPLTVLALVPYGTYPPR